MTNKTDFTFLSSDGKTRLHGIAWVPEDVTPVAVLQLVHGVAEYIGRYDDFARFLNSYGVIVVGHDHLGHGLSLPEGGTPVYFGDGNTWNTPVDDIYVLHTKLKEQYPHLPLLLMGHSMGSFLSRTYLIRYPGTVKAAVLMGHRLAERRHAGGRSCAGGNAGPAGRGVHQRHGDGAGLRCVQQDLQAQPHRVRLAVGGRGERGRIYRRSPVRPRRHGGAVP